MNIKENLNFILEEIKNAEKKACKQSNSTKLLAVSKFHPKESIIQAINAGQLYFGENRVQEATLKFSDINKEFSNIELHIIGQLQTNKVKKAVEIASFIESVDRIELIKEIEKQCTLQNKKINVFFEIHTAEDSKSGYKDFDELRQSIDYIANGNTTHIVPKGFMTMAPFTNDESDIRKSFVKLRELSNKIKDEYKQFNFTELSMGMSHDYKIAIEEGSTEVRIGTAIFGERNY